MADSDPTEGLGPGPAATLDLVPGAPDWAPGVRRAVKAVALAEDRVLLLRGTRSPGLKFPGGGTGPGEGDRAALERELREETGRGLTWFGDCALTTVEERPDADADAEGTVFRMQSRYYPVAVTDPTFAVRLDDYEHHLGLHAVWLSLADAVVEQRAAVEDPGAPTWARRELLVLEWLAVDASATRGLTAPNGSA
jgi:8-oxo-dGTP pyrophosphatase MutT (NUDIX family)